MIFTETNLKGSFILDIERRNDERGFFGRTYCRQEFEQYGIDFTIVQSNISYNKTRGTLRGIHMQDTPHTEAKLVQCISGSLFDVIIDMRPGSATYLQWTSVELSANNCRMLYIPEGFAHGFLTLEEETRVSYQISSFYAPGAEKAIRWNDPFFNIPWPVAPQVMSDKDKTHPLFTPDNIHHPLTSY